MEETSKKSNGWHLYNESNTVFVFIHGFFSNNRECWANKDGTFWPELITSDSRLDNPAIFLASYYTDIDSGDYKVSDCAQEVLDELCLPGIDGRLPVIEKKNIVFVCHSLGGIVARYMIERNREIFKEKAICLILMASPSYGSDYAKKFSLLIKFYQNRMASQLVAANGSLQDLDGRFRSLIASKFIPNLVGAEAIEHHSIFNLKYLPGFSPIVSKESAARYFGAGKVLSGTNHSSCVKPDGTDHVSHKFLVATYLLIFRPMAFANITTVEKADTSGKRKPDPLFEVYDPVDAPYYILRAVDRDLNNLAKIFSVWLFGGSGYGKTAATRYEFFQHRNAPVQIYIGALHGSNIDHIALLSEIYYTLCDMTGSAYLVLDSAHKIVAQIGAMLISRGIETGIILVIDEIPPLVNAETEIPKFISTVLSLIALIKRESNLSNVSLIFNSIFDPTEYFSDTTNKIAAEIKFIEVQEWGVEKLHALAKLIIQEYAINIDASNLETIISKAKGSPRFVKTYLKELASKE